MRFSAHRGYFLEILAKQEKLLYNAEKTFLEEWEWNLRYWQWEMW